MILPSFSEETSPQEKIFYEVTEYYCSGVPLGKCDERAPGKKITITRETGSDMNTYSKAFQKAEDDAPLCPIHDTQMIPQLIKLLEN